MKDRHPKTSEKQEKKEKNLTNMLRDYYLEGCEISLEGKEAEPWQVVDFCLREPVSYMMDFISEPGDSRIRHIDFVRIEEKSSGIPQDRYIGWGC